MEIISTMVKLLATLAIGFILNKTGIIDERTNQKLSQLIIQVTNPLLIISSLSSAQGESMDKILSLLLIGIVLYMIMPLLGYGTARLFKVSIDQRGVYAGALIFSNSGFMAFPILQALYGNSAIFYTSILHMPFNLLFFTFQMQWMLKLAPKDDFVSICTKNTFGQRLRNILNNGVIAVILTLFLFFTGFSLPQPLQDTASFIGNITMPLSMLIIGSSVASYALISALKERKILIFTAIRLIFLPIIAFLIFAPIVSDPALLGIIVITIGMPVASILAMAAAPYNNQRKIAALLVGFSTLCSMVTIPIIIILLTKITF